MDASGCVFGGVDVLLFDQWIGFYIRASTSIRFCRLPETSFPDTGLISRATGSGSGCEFAWNMDFPCAPMCLPEISMHLQEASPWIFMDLQGIFMDFTGKVVPQAGKTEFGSARRRRGCGSDPLIKEKISIIINIYTPRPIYTHIRIHIHIYTIIDIWI